MRAGPRRMECRGARPGSTWWKRGIHRVRHPDRPPGAREPGPVRIRLGRLRPRRRERTPRHLAAGRRRHLRAEERAGMDARAPSEGSDAVRAQADAHLGRRPLGDRLRQHQVLRALHREAGAVVGGPPRRHQGHLREARHPRGRASATGGRRRRAVRVRGGLPPDQRGARGAGRHLHGHRHGAPRAPRGLRGVLRHGHPGRRQQVRRAQHSGLVGRLVRLRPARGARHHPPAGLLPHQHREHGPVRAHADHRRRGQLRATTSRAARPRSTSRTRCTPRSSRSS